jgi:hypothetical protein
MQIISFDRTQDIPVVDAIISGPITYERVRLVFDSGCGLTQIDTGEIVGGAIKSCYYHLSRCGIAMNLTMFKCFEIWYFSTQDFLI